MTPTTIARELEALALEIDAATDILGSARRRVDGLGSLDHVHATALRRHIDRAGALVEQSVGVLIAAASWSRSAFETEAAAEGLPPAS